MIFYLLNNQANLRLFCEDTYTHLTSILSDDASIHSCEIGKMSQISSLSRQKSFDFPGTLKLVVMRERNHAWLNFEARGAIAKESKKCLLQLSNLALNQIRGESRLIIQRIKRDLQQLNAIFAFVQAVAKLVGIII